MTWTRNLKLKKFRDASVFFPESFGEFYWWWIVKTRKLQEVEDRRFGDTEVIEVDIGGFLGDYFQEFFPEFYQQ